MFGELLIYCKVPSYDLSWVVLTSTTFEQQFAIFYTIQNLMYPHFKTASQ